MSAEHTPGPWTVDGPPWNQIVWSDAENRVCFLAHSNGLDDARDIATGRLIAAAPDLLAAVYQYRDDMRYPPAPDSALRRLEMINTLIARATGAA